MNIFGIVVCAALVQFSILVSSAPAQSAPVTQPPSRFEGQPLGFEFYKSSDDLTVMLVSHGMSDKKVRVKSRYYTDLAARRAVTVEKLEPTKFWPTCTSEFVNGKFLVAGKEVRTGNTVIELWSCTPPSMGSVSMIGGPQLKPGAVVDKQDLFDSSTPGMGIVMKMWPMRNSTGPATHVLVQFFDSRDIYRLDVAAKTITRVASPTVQPDCMVIPLLAQELGCQTRQHHSEGVLYIMMHGGVDRSAPSILVLRDANVDSILDGFSVYSLDGYQAAGYLSQTAWVD